MTLSALRRFAISTFALIIFGALLATPRPGRAQAAEPRVLLTWRTQTYAPAYFTGKLLPTGNSTVGASVEIIENNRFVDLSGEQIYWYLNGEFAEGGVGLRTLEFRTPGRPGGSVALRVQLPDYNGRTILKTVTVPVARSEAVIEAPVPLGRLVGETARFFARAFFFNVTRSADLSFFWEANGKRPESVIEPELLDVDLSPLGDKATLVLGLTITKPKSITEAATKEARFSVER